MQKYSKVEVYFLLKFPKNGDVVIKGQLFQSLRSSIDIKSSYPCIELLMIGTNVTITHKFLQMLFCHHTNGYCMVTEVVHRVWKDNLCDVIMFSDHLQGKKFAKQLPRIALISYKISIWIFSLQVKVGRTDS